jgi:D-sorbitol dehydrogenase (acceptor)
MLRRFDGRTALVTGAGSGIGRATALRFTQEGARVVAADIDQPGLEETSRLLSDGGGTYIARRTDVSQCSQIRDLVAAAREAFGGINFLVNAAGIVQSKAFFDVTEHDWDRIIAVNQKGTAFMCQIVSAQMIGQARGAGAGRPSTGQCWGKIVNFSSIAGRRGRSFQLHYAASKAAIISITQSAALALAEYGINVNCISPSVVLTPMWETSVSQKAQTLGVTVAAATKSMLEQIPLRRAGTVEEIAAVVAFLCSPDADFITGQTLNVDGGFEMD